MFLCSQCTHSQLRWSGQCAGCSAWNTLVEQEETKSVMRNAKKSGTSKTVVSLQPRSTSHRRIPVKSVELSGVLGGGLVRGGLTLLSGEPGIGKSTLTLELADWCATADTPVIYISGEEGEEQIAGRAYRLGILNPHIHFLHESILENIISTLEQTPHPIVIIDSVSVLYAESFTGATGGVSQIRHIAETCMHYAKKNDTAMILIGHVTKDGDLAGPKTLEHLVDTVLFLEGDKYQSYRMLRALKNRFGPTDALGLFEMDEAGLHDMKNPAESLLRTTAQIGSALTIAVEGSRPVVMEIESLTHGSKFPYPKRSSRGISSAKIDLLIATLSKFGRINLDEDDVYINVSHGLSVGEPAVDLAIAAAMLSSKYKKALDHHLFLGEISLTGAIKPVSNIDKRVEEAKKLGFKYIHTAQAGLKQKTGYGLTLIQHDTLISLIQWIRENEK